MTVPGVFNVESSEIDTIEIDGTNYYRLKIDANTPLISDTTIVKNGGLVYNIFELFILQGKIPFFLKYEDVVSIFTNMPKFTGTKTGKDSLPYEIFTAMIARNKKDPSEYYRNIINNINDTHTKPILWTGLMNIYYSFGSTLAKVAGSYMKTGTLVAMVSPQHGKPTKLEKVLRG